jgi:hypothetical protein
MSRQRTRHAGRSTLRTVSIAVVIPRFAITSGCGGDDQASASPTDTLSRSSWIEEVNARCVEHNGALGDIIGPLFASGPPSPDDAQTALDDIVARTRDITAEIDALAEPSALTIHVSALVAALDAGSDRAEELGGEAFFATDEDPYQQAADIAGELGLDACDTED